MVHVSAFWKKVRWVSAASLVIVSAAVLLISHTTNHLHECSIVTDTAGLPKSLAGQGQQSALRLPVKVCSPLTQWTVLPLAALSLILLLPDYAEVGFGNFGLKRLEKQISDQVDVVREEVQGIRSSLAAATGIHKDLALGEVRKGAIRNVELRLQTVQEVLLGTLLAEPSRQAHALYETGIKWGESWSQDFAQIEDTPELSTPDHIKRVLEDWSAYDGSAGMGRIYFRYGPDGLPNEAEVVNGFLSIERDGADLRNLIGGYIAGSLNGLFRRAVEFNATLATKTVGRDVYELDVRPLDAPAAETA
jgi:hypothetical protein